LSAKNYLNFSLLVFNGEQRDAYLKQVRAFERANPHISVNIQAIESERYKANIETWLAASEHSDVMFWFGGERLNWYIRKNWVAPIDALWKEHDWHTRITQSAQSAVTQNGHIYGLPIHYYHWGLYYKKSLFKRLKLKEPETWNDFLEICQTLKANDIIPIALGSKEIWPVAGWFDYLNLRINGLAFHHQLTRGEISYGDTRIDSVFKAWQALIQDGYFVPNHADLYWRDAPPYLYHELAGVFLMGSFWTSQIPEGLRHDIGVFRFPIINPEIGVYEEAPTDVLFIPKNAKNKRAAAAFLHFMSQPHVQHALNAELSMLAPQVSSVKQHDPFLKIGTQILESAEGASQYYDRDNPQPIATKGMQVMQAFMLNPNKTDTFQKSLDALREASFR